MKERSHSFKALGYLAAPVVLAIIAILSIYATMQITLPEAYAQYEVLLTVITFFLVGFSMLCAAPCAVMTVVHSILAMVKDKKFAWPVIMLHLDLLIMVLYGYFVYLLFR